MTPSGKDHVYYIYCDCKEGCKHCEDGKIYIHECPYEYIDNEIIIFKQMYSRYQNGVNLYGSFNELPSIIWQYFNVLENEINKHKQRTEEMKQVNADFSAKIMSGKNG